MRGTNLWCLKHCPSVLVCKLLRNDTGFVVLRGIAFIGESLLMELDDDSNIAGIKSVSLTFSMEVMAFMALVVAPLTLPPVQMADSAFFSRRASGNAKHHVAYPLTKFLFGKTSLIMSQMFSELVKISTPHGLALLPP